jgi:hypothetical protein
MRIDIGIISILFSAFLFGQAPDTLAVDADTAAVTAAPVDTTIAPPVEPEPTVMDTTIADTTISEEEKSVEVILDTIPPELMGLDYGYKGFAWGTPKGVMPRLPYMDTTYFSPDSNYVIMRGKLGYDPVTVSYVFADSGFWKVEIEFLINQRDMDEQIKQFTKIEKSITAIYGPPGATSQIIAGPSAAYSDLMHIKFMRAFYHSSWEETPCRIELLLHALVQTPSTELPIIEGNTSRLLLIYYNPDYMIVGEDIPEQEPIPSIFDLF